MTSVISTGIATVDAVAVDAAGAVTATMGDGDGLVNTVSLRTAAALGAVVRAGRTTHLGVLRSPAVFAAVRAAALFQN